MLLIATSYAKMKATTLFKLVVVETSQRAILVFRLLKRFHFNFIYLLKRNSYCGKNPSLRPALPSDLLIVCSEWDIGHVSESLTPEDEVILEVTGYTNHPGFDLNIGPIGDSAFESAN